MSYIYQIIIPPLFLWLFQKLGSQPRLALISMPLLLFNAVWICQVLLNPAFLDQGDSKAWAGLYQYVDSSQAVLNSPIIVSEMIRLGMQPVDSGQTGYYYQIKPFSENILLGPSYDAIKEQGQQYNRTINEKIKNQEFARLILVEGDRSLYPFNLIDQYYSQEMSFPVEMPQTFEQWTIEIWEPKGSIQDTNP